MSIKTRQHNLQDGEEILWQGRPNDDFLPRTKDIAFALLGLGFIVVSIFFAFAVDREIGVSTVFTFAVGLYFLGAALFGARLKWTHTSYTLTNQRALIDTHVPALPRRFRSYSIGPYTQTNLIEGTHTSIMFARELRIQGLSLLSDVNGVFYVPVGFERVTDLTRLQEQFRKIQQGDA